MPAVNPATGSRLALDVDGTRVTALRSFSGLGVLADIAQTELSPMSPPKKHVAAVRFTPARLRTGLGLGKGLYTWLKAALEGNAINRSGTFRRGDFNGKVQSVHKFSDALITEFTVPRLDASSRDPGLLDIAFATAQLDWAGPSGETLAMVADPKPKAWLLSNFKVAIGKLPCSRVAAVESLTWSATLQTDTIGAGRFPTQLPGKVSVPDLKLSISAADLAPWATAAHQWFIEGRRTEGDEMSGRITLLGSNLADELATIELGNVGFKSFAFPDAGGNSDQVERFTVELYAERLRLVIPELGG